MAQGWLPTAPDQRTFALQLQRLLDDLNKPDLMTLGVPYLQDAIRHFQRKPFFFNDTDNTTPQTWAPATYYTQGATLMVPARHYVDFPAAVLAGREYFPWTANHAYDIGFTIEIVNDEGLTSFQTVLVPGVSGATEPTWTAPLYGQTQDGTVTWICLYRDRNPDTPVLAVVNLTAGLSQDGSGTGELPPDNPVPLFTTTPFTIPPGTTSPPAYTRTLGTTVDGGCLWATVGTWSNVYTQLATVPYQNQYVPPLDYVAPRRVEVTWSGNLRIGMTGITYDELRDYDVIRPTPPTTYPTWWAWYQQQVYFWPYPIGFYPITLSYRASPPLPREADDTNFWTTKAEALIRYFAAGRISEAIMQDMEAAQKFYVLANQELSALVGQRIQQENRGEGDGIPAQPW